MLLPEAFDTGPPFLVGSGAFFLPQPLQLGVLGFGLLQLELELQIGGSGGGTIPLELLLELHRLLLPAVVFRGFSIQQLHGVFVFLFEFLLELCQARFDRVCSAGLFVQIRLQLRPDLGLVGHQLLQLGFLGCESVVLALQRRDLFPRDFVAGCELVDFGPVLVPELPIHRELLLELLEGLPELFLCGCELPVVFGLRFSGRVPPGLLFDLAAEEECLVVHLPLLEGVLAI
mmetsp:Transcript_26708/g.73478  ORF Transcript_26708/g.73478 Transcript_26708/m.73478 type:complete len:231 (-) Transcript_26708:473-1165(-)